MAFVIGKRMGYGEYSIEPHNIPLTLIGGALLWFGWFGFNGGSSLGANSLAVKAIVNTFIASFMGGLVWMIISWLKGKPGSLSMISGVIAGLAAITPAAGFVDVRGAMVIGLIAGILCYIALNYRVKKEIDESLDAWAIHGIGGTWGSLAVGIFGNFELFKAQLIEVVATIIYAFVVTYVIAKIVDAIMGLRVSDKARKVG